ncbi:MAG: T9SS type A sorting domain-containing protein [Lentimicrobiaceae bacterium]|nr:T9SS type A sorting domain-containing protein [Lentimicrobiaceae bacterium]
MLKKMLLLLGLLAGMLSVQAQTWYFEDFEDLSILGPTKPDGWEVSAGTYGGATFSPAWQGMESDMAFGATNMNANGDYWFYTQLCALGTQPIVEFYYKTAGVIGDAPDNCMSLELAVSTDGTEWTTVKKVEASDFVSSSDYRLFRETLPESYADQSAHIRIKAIPDADAGTVNLYIDNFGVGTKAETKAKDLMIQGEIAGAAMPTVNTEAEYKFSVFNNGSEAQAAYSVQLLDGTLSLLASQNITETIEAGASAEHTLKYTPTKVGADKLYAVVVLSGDENPANDTATMNIEVQETGNIIVEVGKGSSLTDGVPFRFSQKTGVDLTLYLPEDLNAVKGSISALIFEGKFTKEITCATQVYIGETDYEAIPYDPETYDWFFIDPSTLTKVFDGEMTFPEGDRQSVRFTFTQPFAYSGTKTLAVYTYSKVAEEDVLEWGTNQFYAISTMGGNTVVLSNSGDNLDPMKPDEGEWGGSPVFYRPNTKFVFSSVSDEKYNLTFAVKDAAGNAVSNAVITLNGEKQEAGKYVFEDLTARSYNYIVEKEGFVPARGTLRLVSDTTLAVTLVNMADYPGLSGFLFEDFENIAQNKRPLNWTGDFYVDEQGGKDNGQRLTHSFWYMDGPRSITTNPVYMGSEPVFELEYRVMDYETYPQNAFAGENMSWTVSVSEDFGETWETLYEEDYGKHVSSKDYKPFSVDVSDYAGKICQFMIYVNRDYSLPDAFYFDIDNLKIGTQLTNDLAVVSKIEGLRVLGSQSKTSYTVCVRNQGTAAAENYSIKFYDGETEIGSVVGTKLESGAFSKMVYEHTFTQEGEHSLTAVCVLEEDELALNNATSELYVSVLPQDVRSRMVDAYEGEDITYSTPLRVYDKNSLSWILYNKNDLDMEAGNNISGMAFRTRFSRSSERMHLVVYMGEVEQENIMTSVPKPTSLTKVFDGGVIVEAKDGGNLVLNFDRPYPYTGKNIVVAVYKESSSVYSYSDDCGFYGYYSLGAVSVISTTDDEPIDLSAINLTGNELLAMASFTKPSTIFLLNDNVSYYSVSFEIIDQNGNAVNNATVTFDGTVMPAGQYKVENVPDGTYAYSVSLGAETVNGEVSVEGADVVEKVQLQHVANESNLEQTMVRIYPNPTEGKLHIDMPEGAKEINLYDISGRMVRKLNRVPAGVIELDMTDCHNGIYLLKIDNRAFKVSKR